MKKFADPERTTPLGTLRYAIEFYAAALAVDDALGEEPGYEKFAPIPVNYAMGHALELGLKAILLHAGATLQFVRYEVGHDLEKAVDAANAKGLAGTLSLTPADQDILTVVNALYASKEFEYIETGPKVFPVFGPFQDLTTRVLMAAATLIPQGEILLRTLAGTRLRDAASLLGGNTDSDA